MSVESTRALQSILKKMYCPECGSCEHVEFMSEARQEQYGFLCECGWCYRKFVALSADLHTGDALRRLKG